MRLINVSTLELEQFYGDKTPRYAILSHTWDGDNEVTFQEWERRADAAVRRKSGYAKIVGACRRAQADGLQYLWCDTNCIDKTSSAELSEAINSMFAWYHDSHVCYAYLADIQAKTNTFAKSRWFSRGWTLQELLAPSIVIFFDRRWAVLGTRSELARVISSITRIHIRALEDRSMICDYSTAQRMSWAAGRQTTRSEDIAYCLLGIFDINMPLLYGEGMKAFARLQQEIIKISNDQSLFAWTPQTDNESPWTNALASSPTDFKLCDSIVKHEEVSGYSYSTTNLVGLNCARELQSRKESDRESSESVYLKKQFQIWIPLHHFHDDIYVRGHQPASNIFLGQSYSFFVGTKYKNLFIATNISRFTTQHLQNSSSDIFLRATHPLSTSLLTTVASGTMMPRYQTFKEAYPLGELYIISLRRRAAMTSSHQLISSGNLTVILSVFWDQYGLPKEYLHTTIVDPKLCVSKMMASEEKWRCLFGTYNHPLTSECCNSVASLHKIHSRLRHAHGGTMSTYIEEQKHPLVQVDIRSFQSLLGTPEVIFDVIFRERPKFTGRREMQQGR